MKTDRTYNCIGISAILISLALLSGCTGGGSAPPPPPPTANPVPSIASLSPSSTTAGAQGQTLTIQGSNFLSTSTVTYNGQAHAATFVNSTQLTVSLSASDQATAGNFPVVASNPAPGGGQSNSATFTVNNPQPALSSVSPSVVAAGSPDTPISVIGANFVAQSTVNLNGTALPTSFASPTQLSATVPANSLATSRINRITVTDPTPGGGTSAALNLTVFDPLPANVAGPLIESIPPSAALVGKPIQYQVIASSASPSSLVFSLSTSPTGMTINTTNGLLQWTPGSNQAGDQAVTIVAQDSAGQTSQNFTLSVFGSRAVASATISAAAGGMITVNDTTSTINGLSISIPAGALSADTTITVSELISPPTLGGTPRFLLKGFSVDPDGTQLAIPAHVTIPYSVNEFAKNQGIPLEDFLGVYFVDTSTGGLENLNSFIVNKVSHTLAGTVQHFSVYEVTNFARLCPPHLLQNEDPKSCPDSYQASSSPLPPAVLVHGFQLSFSSGGAMGDESTWDQLRYLLAGLGPSNQPGSPVRVDAWRFDWDSVYTPFESSAANLGSALHCIDVGQCQPGTFPGLGRSPHLVNLVAHSFGGILVRTYLEGKATSLPYNNDVNRLITLGTPHSGIGGSLSTFYASACANAAQATALAALQLPTPLRPLPEPITCFEASTRMTGVPGTGAFLNNLNSVALPPLNPSLTPQYDLIAGRRISCPLIGACSLQQDDGLITTPGNNLCGTLPGGGGVAVGDCSKTSVAEDINSDTITVPAGAGLCHSSSLFPTTCFTLPDFNIAIAAVHDTNHPLWGKICSFLGGCAPPQTLNVLSTNPSSGAAITASPADNNGTSSQNTPLTLTYNNGAVLNLAAAPTASGNSFSSWTGCDTVAGIICTVTINSDRTVTANYVPPPPPMPHTVTVASTNPSSGAVITVSPADNSGQSSGNTPLTLMYNNSAVVTLTAAPTAGGNNFSSWTGCDTVMGTMCRVTINADRAVAANYLPPLPGTLTLTVASTNPSSGAAITVSPADNVGQSSGVTQFTLTYNNSVMVTLAAASTAGGNSFSSWTGCDSSSGTSCTVTMNANRTVTASYGGQLAQCAYVANELSSSVSAYTVDPLTGKLGAAAGSPFAVVGLPISVAADPSGRFLYVADSTGGNSLWVSAFVINSSTCALTGVPGSPFPPISLNLTFLFPTAVAVHPSGKFLYMTSQTGAVACFTIDPTTGALSQCAGSPAPAGLLTNSIALYPTGSFAYATNQGSANVSGYSVDFAAGNLAPVAGSPFGDACNSPGTCLPSAIALDPLGKFAYVANSDATICVYDIDAASGMLSPRLPCFLEPNLQVASFTWATVHKSGNFVLASAPATAGGTGPGFAAVYRIDRFTGDLSAIVGSPFVAGSGPSSITVDVSGQFVYVTNGTSSSISCYAIDGNTGVLTQFDCGISQTGALPSSIVVR